MAEYFSLFISSQRRSGGTNLSIHVQYRHLLAGATGGDRCHKWFEKYTHLLADVTNVTALTCFTKLNKCDKCGR